MLEDALGTLAEEFHLASRNRRRSMRSVATPDASLAPSSEPRPVRPDRLLDATRLALPLDPEEPRMSLAEALRRRSSGRRYGDAPMRLAQLATVLRCGAGIARADATGGAAWRRHAPSSGALGSATVYPIVIRVSGIDAGIYHYDGTGHDLALVRRGRLESWLRERVLYQREFSLAAVVLVVASAIAPLAERYGIRGYRLALLDAGHVSQNLQLAAAALGLSACAVAGFIDSELDDALGLDGVSDASLLCVAMGLPPETGSP